MIKKILFGSLLAVSSSFVLASNTNANTSVSNVFIKSITPTAKIPKYRKHGEHVSGHIGFDLTLTGHPTCNQAFLRTNVSYVGYRTVLHTVPFEQSLNMMRFSIAINALQANNPVSVATDVACEISSITLHSK